MTLRCTGKLLERLNLPSKLGAGTLTAPNSIVPFSIPPTTALGDWYAHILFTQPAHLILTVSEKSRLCLILPARELSTLETRFQTKVAELLRRMGIPEAEIECEVQKMSPLAFGSTKIYSETGTSVNRSVLGSINEFARIVKWSLQLGERNLGELAEDINQMSCSALDYEFPIEVARDLLRAS